MKITKRQLVKIIKEEMTSTHNTSIFSEQVRRAYATHLVLNHALFLVSEGYITPREYVRVQRCCILNESTGISDAKLRESIGDVVAKVAMAVGKEVGKAGQGVAKGMWDAIYPITKRVAGAGVEAASDSLAWTRDNIDKVISSAGKLVGNSVKGGREAFGSLKKGVTAGLDYKSLAKKDPEAFLTAYEALKKTLTDAGAPVGTAKTAAAALGVFETEDGQKALEHGAKKAGMSPEELKSLLGMYVLQSKHVDLAVKAKESVKGKESPAETDEK